jgi:hypothetical protein
MRNHRRAILSLVALGRVTPAEAERLIVACNEGREVRWIFAACIAVALAAQLNLQPGLAALAHLAHSLLAGGTLHRALALLANITGGTQ